ncbi:MAG: hypothetical protein QG553_423 [Patescibacteria group bacterium]|nr:hypothetical protein [Patescibacteria group bacterium]
MTVRTFLRLTASATAVIGPTLLLFPGFINELFVVSPAHGSDIFIRFLGSALIGYTYLNWYSAHYSKTTSIHPTLVGNFSTLSIALILSIIAVLNGSLKASGWAIVLLHLVFASGFGWFLWRLRPDAQHSS